MSRSASRLMAIAIVLVLLSVLTASVLVLGRQRPTPATESAAPGASPATADQVLLLPTSQPSPTPQVMPTVPATAPPAERIYWGAWLDGPPSAASFERGGLIDSFEARVGKRSAIVHWGLAWRWRDGYQTFPEAFFDNIRQHGSIPMLDWGSWVAGASPDQPEFRLATITSGEHDVFIRQWARDAKAWGHPFFLRFNWEMNGNWKYPWSEQLNGNQPGDYMQAWRHVHDIFTEVGATNATWVWCPNIAGGTTVPLAELYPGDTYVDWVCLTGFNAYPTWLSFEAVFTARGIDWLHDSYTQVQAVAPGKPLMVVTGSLEAGDGGAEKAAWITEALGPRLAQNFPSVNAIVWFNWDGDTEAHASLPLESSPASQAAFALGIQSAYFAENEFSALDTLPIPPLD